MPNQTFDRSPHSIPLHTSEPTAPLRRGASIARSMILQSVWPLVVLACARSVRLWRFSQRQILSACSTMMEFMPWSQRRSARAIGYRIISLPGEPYQTKYPFLYSYLLSWAWSLNPQFPDVIALLNFVTVPSFISRLFCWPMFSMYENSNGGKADALLYVFLVGANAFGLFHDQLPVERHPVHGGLRFAVLPYPIPANSFTDSDQINRAFERQRRHCFYIASGRCGADPCRPCPIRFSLGNESNFTCYIVVVGCLILPWVLWQAMHGSVVSREPASCLLSILRKSGLFFGGLQSRSCGSDHWRQSPLCGSDRGFYDAPSCTS